MLLLSHRQRYLAPLCDVALRVEMYVWYELVVSIRVNEGSIVLCNIVTLVPMPARPPRHPNCHRQCLAIDIHYLALQSIYICMYIFITID